MEGKPLPITDADAEARGFERSLIEWDSCQPDGTDVHSRTIVRDDLLCTTYRPGTMHDGTEGELYDLIADPLQRVNLWDDPSRQSVKADLLADLFDNLVESTMELRPQAPV